MLPETATQLAAPLVNGAPACVPFVGKAGTFSASAMCKLGSYERPADAQTFSTFFEYGTAAISGGFGNGGARSKAAAPPLPPAGQSCSTKLGSADTYDYVQRGPGAGMNADCYPFLYDTSAPNDTASVSWTCDTTMTTTIDNATPDCNAALAVLITVPSVSSTGTPSRAAPSVSATAGGSGSRTASVTRGISHSGTPTASATQSTGYSRSAARTASVTPTRAAVYAYDAPASGEGCVQQFEPIQRGVLQYPYEFMSSTCAVPVPPFKLTTGIIIVIALAAVGALTIIPVAVICYLQARRAVQLRKQRASSVRTLMHAASAAGKPVVIDAMSIVQAPETNVLMAKRIAAGSSKQLLSASFVPPPPYP